jgi:hypothetical protein
MLCHTYIFPLSQITICFIFAQAAVDLSSAAPIRGSHQMVSPAPHWYSSMCAPSSPPPSCAPQANQRSGHPDIVGLEDMHGIFYAFLLFDFFSAASDLLSLREKLNFLSATRFPSAKFRALGEANLPRVLHSGKYCTRGMVASPSA